MALVLVAMPLIVPLVLFANLIGAVADSMREITLILAAAAFDAW